MRLIILGAPGSGKGTQAVRLARKHAVPQIATGDILRSEIARGTSLGVKAQEDVGKGALVPDDVMLAMMEVRLAQPDAAGGFILDGFPRSLPQAEGLDRILKRLGVRLDAAIKLDVPKKVLLDRMIARRVCSGCAAVYNLQSGPPKVAGVCDHCKGALVQREDDTPETVRRRLSVYAAATSPLIDFYDSRGLLVIAYGEGSVDEVEASIEHALESHLGGGR